MGREGTECVIVKMKECVILNLQSKNLFGKEASYYETKDIQYTTQSSAGGEYDPGVWGDGQCG